MMRTSRGDRRRAGFFGRTLEKRDLIAGEIMIGLVAGGVGMVCARLVMASAAKAWLAGLRRWAADAGRPVEDTRL